MTEKAEESLIIMNNQGEEFHIDFSDDASRSTLTVIKKGEITAQVEIGDVVQMANFAEAVMVRVSKMAHHLAENGDPRTDPTLIAIREKRNGSRPSPVVDWSRMHWLKDRMMTAKVAVGRAASLAEEGGRKIRFTTHAEGPYVRTRSSGDEEEVTLREIGLQENATEGEIEECLSELFGEPHAIDYVEYWTEFEEIENND